MEQSPRHTAHIHFAADKTLSSSSSTELQDAEDGGERAQGTHFLAVRGPSLNRASNSCWFPQGQYLQPWYPSMVHSSAHPLRSVAWKCTELSPTKVAFAHLLHLPAYVAIGTAASASAACCSQAGLAHLCSSACLFCWPHPASSSSLTRSLPHPLFLGGRQSDYCCSS